MSNTATSKITPQTVSRRLRDAGFCPVAPSDRHREGIKVTNGFNGPMIRVDLDSTAQATKLAGEVQIALLALGYTVTRRGSIVAVTGMNEPMPEYCERVAASELEVGSVIRMHNGALLLVEHVGVSSDEDKVVYRIAPGPFGRSIGSRTIAAQMDAQIVVVKGTVNR